MAIDQDCHGEIFVDCDQDTILLKRGTGNAHINPNRDREHGRIYRVVYEGHTSKAPKLDTTKHIHAKELVSTLSHDNLFWRLTAQRLLVDGKKKDAAPALRKRIKSQGQGAIHALWTLEGLGELDEDSHRSALVSPDPALRRNAIRSLGTSATSTQLLFDSATMTDKDSHVRLAAFVKLGQQLDKATVKKTATFLMEKAENAKDEWLRLALNAAGAGTLNVIRYETGENLIRNASFENGLEGWSFRNYSGPAAEVDGERETAKANIRSGKGSLRLGSRVGHDTSYNTPVKLNSGRKYRLSAWIKTEGIQGAHGALLNVHELQHAGKTKALQKKNDWLEVEKVFTAPRSGNFTINCLLGGWGKSKGTAWFDDLSLTEYKPVYAKKTATAKVKGEVKAGNAIFHKHLVAGCIRCHSLGGKGGAIGPALDGIAARKQRDYIYQSLVNPTAQLAEGFDKIGASPMPPMNILLNEQELADLMAYLMTLR